MAKDNDEKTLSERFDKDDKLISRGKVLTTVSLVLIVLEVSGAVIKEANTFLFEIEFTHQEGITYLLLVSVMYLAVRYRNYAQSYHRELFILWSDRMMKNKDVFYYSHQDETIKGLLGDAFDVWGGDEPGIQYSKYVKTSVLKRGITYPTILRGGDDYEDYIEEEYDEYFSLLKFNKKWTFIKYLSLLFIEFKYRLSAFINSREHLDILSPYIFAMLAILSFIYRRQFFI